MHSLTDVFTHVGVNPCDPSGKACGAILATGLVSGLACVFSGCDAGGSQLNGTKPIQPNILEKLAKANQSQVEVAKTTAVENKAKAIENIKNKKK